MKGQLIFFAAVIFVAALLLASKSLHATFADGKTAFDTYCSGCHPEGRNPQNPAKNLLKIDREANGIRSAADIIRKMRNPGAGMRQFTKQDISDKTAKEIADYIIGTFR